MDVSEVKVLARRANGMLIVVPILMLFSGFALVYSVLVLIKEIEPNRDVLYVLYMLSIFDGRRRHRHFEWRYNSNPETIAFTCAFSYGLECAFFFWLLACVE